MSLTAFLAAWFLHLLAAASPGPAILMSARIGVTNGMQAGLFYAFGCALGALVWALAAFFGLSLLFQVAPTILWGFKLAGGLFLLWIAFQMWRHAGDPMPDATAATTPKTGLAAVRLGLATQLANPKPAVFFGAVFVGTVPPDASAFAIALLFLAIFVNELACTAGVARVFSFDRSRKAYAKFKSRIDKAFGGILGLLGIKVALT